MTTPAATHRAQARPEPVTNAAALAGAIAGVLITLGGLLRLLGLLPVSLDVEAIADQVSNMVMAIAVLWAITGPWLLARLRARDKVTPLDSPRGEDGIPLITTAEAREWADDVHARAWDQAFAQALDQARDEYHAAMVAAGQVVDDPGHHAARDATPVQLHVSGDVDAAGVGQQVTRALRL